jgi:general secretion pathway protein I
MAEATVRCRAPRASGFTLIEVMVALTVVAFAFVALLGLHNRNLAMIGRDADLTDAMLLARQLITEMEVTEQWPDTGGRTGEYAGFVWEREVEDTELPSVRRVRLRVARDPASPSACEILYYIRDRRNPDDAQRF